MTEQCTHRTGTQAYATTVAEENPTTADLATAADGDEPGPQQFDEVQIETRSQKTKKEDEDLFFPDDPEDEEDEEEIDMPCVCPAERVV